MVELILSMFVLSILSLLLVNVLGGAMQTSEMANRVAGQASDFRETFERIGSMSSVADVGSGKACAVVKDEGIGMPGSKNDAMVLVTGARPQSRSGTRSDLYTSGAVVGFRVTAPVVDADTQQLMAGPGLAYGDSAMYFPRSQDLAAGKTDGVAMNWGKSLLSAAAQLDVAAAKGGAVLPMNYQSYNRLGDAIVRMEVNFVLNDGTVSVLPPQHRFFPVNATERGAFYAALDAEYSLDPAGRYVRGVVVSLATLDEATVRKLSAMSTAQGGIFQKIAEGLDNPTADPGQSGAGSRVAGVAMSTMPLQLWDPVKSQVVGAWLDGAADLKLAARSLRVSQNTYLFKRSH
jgi:type II secretory pathway pseudopilin PulG